MRHRQPAVARALTLLDAISDTFATRDWAALRGLYDDGALIVSVAGGDRVLSADELIEILSAVEGGSYGINDAETEALDENAVVVSGLVRERHGAEATFTPNAWVLTSEKVSSGDPGPTRRSTTRALHTRRTAWAWGCRKRRAERWPRRVRSTTGGADAMPASGVRG